MESRAEYSKLFPDAELKPPAPAVTMLKGSPCAMDRVADGTLAGEVMAKSAGCGLARVALRGVL
jgi:hypothetical protein